MSGLKYLQTLTTVEETLIHNRCMQQPRHDCRGYTIIVHSLFRMGVSYPHLTDDFTPRVVQCRQFGRVHYVSFQRTPSQYLRLHDAQLQKECTTVQQHHKVHVHALETVVNIFRWSHQNEGYLFWHLKYAATV